MKQNRLSERAMLVRLSGHQWTGQKKDKMATHSSCVANQAKEDAISVIVNLMPPSELKPVTSAWGRVYRKFHELTLPMYDGGLRVLPSAMYMSFRSEMQELTRAYHDAVDVLIKRWPEIIKASPDRLGKLASNHRLPSAADLKSRFWIGQDILPMPEISDFRLDMPDEVAEDVMAEIARGINAGTANSTIELYSRLSDLVGEVAETMGQPDKKFRDTIITKLKKFCDVIPKYNITDNAELNKVRDEVVAKLAGLDPEDLREIPNHRKKAGKDAKDILAKISGYMK